MTDWQDVSASTQPPAVPGWPFAEVLESHGVVLARPRVADAEALYALQSDPRLYVDVPAAWRVQSVVGQADDIRRYVAHWHEYGFGYWVVWPAGTDPTATGVGVRPRGVAGLRWMWWRGEWVLNVFVRFAAAAQRRGLATAVLGHAMSRLDADLVRPVRVVVRTRQANAAMVALSRRLGMVDTGHEEREMGTYRVLEGLVGGPGATQTAAPDVRVRAAGPWIVQAHVPVATRGVPPRNEPAGVVAPDPRHGDVALCRCGETDTPPTCDRSHVGVAMADLACTAIDDELRLAAAACPPGSVVVLAPEPHLEEGAEEDRDTRSGGEGPGVSAHGRVVAVGAGVRLRLLDGRVVRAPVSVIACRCGAHVTPVVSMR
ncbi:MAG TPA: GNAT family N-acetyltransferase [Nitriliruptoraceae bacterium]|nr:GNAT family N-acetyltransferase [Nitriliruptoraceae bacterium]